MMASTELHAPTASRARRSSSSAAMSSSAATTSPHPGHLKVHPTCGCSVWRCPIVSWQALLLQSRAAILQLYKMLQQAKCQQELYCADTGDVPWTGELPAAVQKEIKEAKGKVYEMCAKPWW